MSVCPRCGSPITGGACTHCGRVDAPPAPRMQAFRLWLAGAVALGLLVAAWGLLGPERVGCRGFAAPEAEVAAALARNPFQVPPWEWQLGSRPLLIRPGESPELKLGPYRSCLNFASGQVRRALQAYAAWAGEGATLAGPPADYTPGAVPVVQTCLESMARTGKVAQDLGELDGAARAWTETLAALARELAWLERYYRDRDWKDDDLAAGRAHHPAILAAWRTLAGREDRFRALLADLLDAHRQKAIAVLADRSSGRLALLALREAAAARALARAVSDRPDLPHADLAPLLSAFLAADVEAADYAPGHPAETAEWPTWLLFADAAAPLRSAAKALARDGREPAVLVEAYNRFAEVTGDLVLRVPDGGVAR